MLSYIQYAPICYAGGGGGGGGEDEGSTTDECNKKNLMQDGVLRGLGTKHNANLSKVSYHAVFSLLLT